MKAVHQTKFDDKGNCLQACIASLLHIPIEDIPDFSQSKNWCGAFEFFMQTKGYATVINNCIECYPKGVFYIAWGKSPRGYEHSVIYWNGELAHDPHPEGGDVKVEQIVYFVESFNRMAG